MSKTAIVTGSSRGIGAAVAQRLAADGFDIAVCCVNRQEDAQNVCRIIRENGRNAQFYRFDVANYGECEEAVNTVTRDFGRIDALINNGGIALYKMINDTDDDEYDRVMDVNMKGVFNMTKAVLPHMIHRKSGKIVNISSMWGVVGGSCESVYSASKAAVIGFTKASAKELGPSGINVNCVAPGVIRTEMLDGLSESTLEALREETSLCRLGTPQDIANVVSFLVSKNADFISGQVISADGGL